MLRIVSWNVNGISSRKNEITALVYELKPDILLLQETWLKPNLHFSIAGYSIYRKDRENKTRGGVAIAIQENIEHEQIGLDMGKTEIVTLKVKTQNKYINISSVYFPGRTTRKKDIFEIKRLKPHALVAGDFNARNELWGSSRTDQMGNYIDQLCQSEELLIHIPSEPTRRATRRGDQDSTIDYALTTSTCSELNIEVIGDLGTTSDHLPLLLQLNLQKIKKTENPLKLTTKWDKVLQDLDRTWTTTGDPDYDIENFTSAIQAAILTNSRGIEIKSKNHLLLPENILSKMKEKREAVKTYQKYKTKYHKAKMKKIKREFDLLFRKQEREKIIKELESLNDPVLRWQVIRKGRPQPPPVPLLVRNGKKARTNQEKAEMLAEALSDKFVPFDTPQDTAIKEDIQKTYEEITNLHPGSIPNITAKEVKHAIHLSNAKSATGPDGIPYKLLKKLNTNSIDHITKIFNCILQTRRFPKIWKRACVTMLPKPNKPKGDPSSYRPISLLSCLSKIFERCLLKHILTKALPNYQFGFRPKHGTTHQLTRIIHDSTENINKKFNGIIISLDIEAAFDKVPHPELIYKLKQQNQPVWLIQLIKSYYQSRKFHVRVNEAISEDHKISAGTAQGAVISALLYSLYIADMPFLEDIKIYQYADDTAYMASTHKMTFSALLLNEQLEKLYQWCQLWRTKINPTKSTALILVGGQNTQNIQLTYGGENIPIVDHFKYLGVEIDRKLNFIHHINSIVQSCKEKTNSLMKYLQKNKIVSTKTRALFYELLIKPSITYGFPSWGSVTNNQLKKLLKIEKQWIRICLWLPKATPKAILYELAPFKTLLHERRCIALKFLDNMKNHTNPLIRNMTSLTPKGHKLYPLQQWDMSYDTTEESSED